MSFEFSCRKLTVPTALALGLASACVAARELPPKPTVADVVKAAKPGEWRVPDPDNTLYLEIPTGRVVIELAPVFAPRHVANIRAILADSSASAISSCSRADGFFDAASFKEAFDGRIDGLADAGGSFALAVPKARQQAVRAISLRIVIRKVKNINRINGCPTAKL